MKTRLGWTATLGMVATIALATFAVAAGNATRNVPVVVRAGNLVLTVNGGLLPRSFPKHSFAAAGWHASADLATVDGSQPPALKKAIFDVDKDVLVDVHGLPTCERSRLIAQDTTHAVAACGDAILGQGKGTVRVAFPEQAPFEADGPLLLFNGGVRAGVTTLYFYSYVSVPAPTAVIAPMTITRENDGPYGTHIVISVPVIAGGSGSVVHTELTAQRRFEVAGERRSALMIRCSRGRIFARGSFEFRDGSLLSGHIVRACEET
jgi:hypothetical protein